VNLGQPLAPGRSTGQAWAREELAKPAYARARPGLLERAVTWLLHGLDRAAAKTGLGAGQLATLVVAVVVVVVVVAVLNRRRVRLSVAQAEASRAVLGGSLASGAEHRRRAQEAAAAGRFDLAVREFMRAVARRLDERGLIDPRPGRTADELAAEAGRILPQLGPAFHEGARTFDDVVYGSVAASAAQAEQLRRLDELVEASRPALLGAGRP
jgi:hypothetical protein